MLIKKKTSVEVLNKCINLQTKNKPMRMNKEKQDQAFKWPVKYDRHIKTIA
jgi:hypothetical protein